MSSDLLCTRQNVTESQSQPLNNWVSSGLEPVLDDADLAHSQSLAGAVHELTELESLFDQGQKSGSQEGISNNTSLD
ncbi:hypothetical protein PENSUB_13062 [Penicillium subrubescens]|uniref:Uncharacterized protein n=1 Tax=Penicillium subrubescens TaxID=1316194 RepID=A0A1Q5SUV7_9EURO|nr:hypothetical protein PENSUB_13062 [Penicillium subrubescens]